MSPTNQHVISVVIFCFLLLNISGKAKVTAHVNESSSSQCNKESIMNNMKIAAEKGREFMNNGMRERLNDRSTGDEDKKCLQVCFQAYANAGEAIARASIEVSKCKKVEAAKEVVAYSHALAPCLICSTKIFTDDAEFMHFQKLVKSNGEDILERLQGCKALT